MDRGALIQKFVDLYGAEHDALGEPGNLNFSTRAANGTWPQCSKPAAYCFSPTAAPQTVVIRWAPS